MERGDCIELFDPCTKEPIASLEALEKRIRDIKKQRDITPVGLYGLTNDTSNYDFLTKVFIDPTISLEDMVSFRLSSGGQVGSDIYEVLSRLFVFFGGIENVNPRQNGNYKFMKKIEGGAPEIYDDSIDALKRMKCKATRAMGISDITLMNVRNDTKEIKPDSPYCEVDCDTKASDNIKTYLISVKWYKDEKNAEHYDLEKLYTAAQKITTAEQRPLDIIVFLKSKKDFEIAHNRSYRQYTRDLAKTFFGWNEDVKPFLEEKRRTIFEMANLTGKTPLEALELQYFKPNAKPSLSLQLHQDIIVKGICDRMEISDDNLYLIGVLPRGGKTFIAGGLIREHLRRNPVENFTILWLTAAPNETLKQVRDELIDRFGDFKNFEFVDIRQGGKQTTKPHTIFFCSSQLLIASEKPTTKERKFLKDLKEGTDKLGLVFFDEAHKTGTGDITKEKLQSVINNYINNLPIIFLTATYYNILFDYQIQKSNIFIWDYTDVLATRSLATETEQKDAISNLRKRFTDELVDNVIARRIANNDTLETMAKAYIGFPDLFFITADFQDETLQRFTEQGKYRPDSGFSLSSIFAIKPIKKIITSENGEEHIVNKDGLTIVDIKTKENKVRKDAYKIFDNLINPKNIISLVTPKESFDSPDLSAIEPDSGKPLTKAEGFPIEPSLLGRINKMSSDAKSRFRLDEQPTMLMFMPTGGTGTNILYLLCGWASLLMTHKWWRENYEIACVVSDEKVGEAFHEENIQGSEGIHIISDDPKASILTLERRLHCQTNPRGLLILAGEKLSMGISLPCTDVVFLFNEKKSPDDIIQKMYRALTPSPGKKSAFIVDLNPVRTLAALYGYTRASHESTNTVSSILNIIYDTYSWDSDIFEYNLKKGSDANPLFFQDKLRQLFEMAEKDPSNEYKINEDIGGFEKRLSENIKRGMNSDFISKIGGQFSSKKLESMLGHIGLKKGSKVSFKNGKLVIKEPKEISNTNETSNTDEEPIPEEEIAIEVENFIETVIDFVKYLAITSSTSTLEGAIEEYDNNTKNEQGTSLRQNVLGLIRSKKTIKNGNKEDILLSKLLIVAVKDFASTSSKEIFRQMKGKIDEKSIRKDKILAIINKRLTIRKKQLKESGEAFTNVDLVDEMLSHLPSSVWSNPNLKWLDPANGIGNFPVTIFYKLDEGLKEWEPNENKRRKHIIENMLYMIEKQSYNNRVARNIFLNLCEKCTPNIITLDSLSLLTSPDKLLTHNFPTEYDIIVGNPPYQPSQLWEKFIILATKLVKKNGYIDFLVPTSWTSHTSDSWKALKTKKIIVINSCDYIKKDYFPKLGSTFSYFLIQNTRSDADTKIYYDRNKHFKANLKDLIILPKIITEDTLSINEKVLTNQLEGKFIRKDREGFHKESNGIYKFPYITFFKPGGSLDIQYLDTEDPRQNQKKVLLFRSGYINPYYDNGINGVGSNIHALKVDTKIEGENIVKLFNSELYKFIWNINKHSQYNHGGLMDMVYRDVSNIHSFTDENIYNFFDITDREKTMIKSFLKGDKTQAEGGSTKQGRFTRKLTRA